MGVWASPTAGRWRSAASSWSRTPGPCAGSWPGSWPGRDSPCPNRWTGSTPSSACVLDRPDVVVLDLEMPRCGGMDALRQIKGDPDLADTEVVLLTGHRDAAGARAALAAGASDYIRKPCDPGELVERVRRVAEARSARRELRTRSSTDELTGLPNRRGIQPLLSGLILPATTAFGPLLANIDHFKAVNDEWGHAASDEVLRAVAARLSRAWPLFTVARWGGEEFLAVGPVLGPDELFEVAERFRLAVAATPVTLAGGPALAVTVSVGASLVERDGPESAAVAAADEALYRAKATGRNRVVVARQAPALLRP
ncbi:MAG TPA: diguanylate cyclase [Acidimicrobiia bacterium]|nr:diguanylate cyclase [Acidimicrobiia bacterium]